MNLFGERGEAKQVLVNGFHGNVLFKVRDNNVLNLETILQVLVSF